MEGKSIVGPGRMLGVTIAPEGAGERLDRALAASLAPPLSRSRVKALIEAGHVRTNGGATITEPSKRVKPGQTFAIFVPEAEPASVRAEALPLDIVYEDADVIVIDKPAGMVVHPAPGNSSGTLVNALLAHCGDALSGIGGVRRPGIVHRLDKDTRGLLVAAKHDAAHRSLAAQFAKHSVERVYTALVWGVPRPKAGEIFGAIGRSRADRKKMAVVARGGRTALTRYRVAQEFAGGAVGLLECRLATGRTHQIRVHFAAKGHPVVGDPVYGRKSARRGRLSEPAIAAIACYPHQALEAVVLGFRHPASHQEVRFERPLSNELRRLISILE
ncbi:MAG TPA: RluA family pseudouridine synthase [Alphaproteobacteria bacterium]|nr:RluA family pseudouridine synthase [Alphaproteobacteria bacterium]